MLKPYFIDIPAVDVFAFQCNLPFIFCINVTHLNTFLSIKWYDNGNDVYGGYLKAIVREPLNADILSHQGNNLQA